MNYKNLKQLYSAKQIDERVKQVGAQISRLYQGMAPLLCICVLKGAAVFFSDLIRCIDADLTIDFITLSSYGQGRDSTGDVALLENLSINPEGKHILLVEDIIDSGITLSFLHRFLHSKNPLSVRSVALLDKPAARKTDASADFIAFTLEGDEFVVGYGLDLNQRYRNLDGIYQIN